MSELTQPVKGNEAGSMKSPKQLEEKETLLALRRQDLGPEHPLTLMALLDYAVMLIRVGQEASAEPMLKEALALTVLDLNRQETLAIFTSEIIETLSGYAVALKELGRQAEAEQLTDELIEVIYDKKELCVIDDDQCDPGLADLLDTKATILDEPKPEEQTIPPVVSENYSAYEASGKKFAVAMFDFDLTLSEEHVFRTLSHFATSRSRQPETTEEPVAVSPAGQVLRLEQEHHKYNVGWAFGSDMRLEELRSMLQRLQDRGVKMMVCTLGYPSPAKKLLEEADLLKYFGWEGVPSVIGMSGSTYQQYYSDFDRAAIEESQFVENPDEILKGSKVALLDELLQKESVRLGMTLPLSAGVVIEDDVRVIRHANIHLRQDAHNRVISSGFINTFRVYDREGLTQDEIEELLRLADA
jgi:phosphoglycolate phosphatase-like HAD superfamily hydrolase